VNDDNLTRGMKTSYLLLDDEQVLWPMFNCRNLQQVSSSKKQLHSYICAFRRHK